MNLFDVRINAYNLDNLSPIQPGTQPENSLAPKFKKVNLVKFFKNGNFPEKLLLYKYKTSRLIKSLAEAGSLPDRLLYPRLRIFSSLKCHKQSGICPVNKLCERSRKDKDPSTIWHKKKISPDNLFWERSSLSKLEGTFSIRP